MTAVAHALSGGSGMQNSMSSSSMATEQHVFFNKIEEERRRVEIRDRQIAQLQSVVDSQKSKIEELQKTALSQGIEIVKRELSGQFEKLKRSNGELMMEIHHRDARIHELHQRVIDTKNADQKSMLQDKISELTATLIRRDKLFDERTSLFYDCQLRLEEAERAVVVVTDEFANAQGQWHVDMAKKDRTIGDLTVRSNELSDWVMHLLDERMTIQESRGQLQETERTLTATVSNLHASLNQKDATMSNLHQTLEDKETAMTSLHQTLEERENVMSSLHQTLEERKIAMTSLHQTLEERENAMSSLHQTIAEKEGVMSSLHQTIAEKEGVMSHLQSSLQLEMQKLGEEFHKRNKAEQRGRFLLETTASHYFTEILQRRTFSQWQSFAAAATLRKLSAANDTISELNLQIGDLEAQVSQLQQSVTEKVNEKEALEQWLGDRETELNEKVASLEEKVQMGKFEIEVVQAEKEDVLERLESTEAALAEKEQDLINKEEEHSEREVAWGVQKLELERTIEEMRNTVRKLEEYGELSHEQIMELMHAFDKIPPSEMEPSEHGGRTTSGSRGAMSCSIAHSSVADTLHQLVEVKDATEVAEIIDSILRAHRSEVSASHTRAVVAERQAGEMTRQLLIAENGLKNCTDLLGNMCNALPEYLDATVNEVVGNLATKSAFLADGFTERQEHQQSQMQHIKKRVRATKKSVGEIVATRGAMADHALRTTFWFKWTTIVANARLAKIKASANSAIQAMASKQTQLKDIATHAMQQAKWLEDELNRGKDTVSVEVQTTVSGDADQQAALQRLHLLSAQVSETGKMMEMAQEQMIALRKQLSESRASEQAATEQCIAVETLNQTLRDEIRRITEAAASPEAPPAPQEEAQ